MVKDGTLKLKGKPYAIKEQFQTKFEDRRRKLYPVMKRYKQAGDKTNMVRDRLNVNGKLYEHDTPPPINAELRARIVTCCRITSPSSIHPQH